MAKHGKKYRAASEKVDPLKQYSPPEGVKLVKETAFAKFDESVELHIRTGLDPKHADQQVRGSAVLPAGTGRTQRVVAFAIKPVKPKPLGRTWSAAKSWCSESRAAGLTSMWRWLPLT